VQQNGHSKNQNHDVSTICAITLFGNLKGYADLSYFVASVV
jgi:hypothetical protein